MAKPEWGIKRTCLSCATRFYDMQRNPIVCPSCGATFEPDASLKSRRSRAAPEPVPAAAAVVAAPAAKAVETEASEAEDALADDEIVDLEDDDDGDDNVIEDTGDLAEDDDAIPAVARDEDKDWQRRTARVPAASFPLPSGVQWVSSGRLGGPGPAAAPMGP